MNPNPTTENQPTIRKTHVITLWDRQRRMMDFYNYPKMIYVALGRTTPWKDENDPNISDTYPPMPLETMTQVEDMIGMQRIRWKKFAKVIPNPQSDQKDSEDTVYYRGLYYETTNDVDYAIENGFTSVMLLMISDRDEYFPIGVSYRQVGVYLGVDETDEYLEPEKYMNLAPERRGNLAFVENFMPLTRQGDQMEQHFVLITF